MNKKYNKNEFVNILCKKCNLCRNIGNPTFCYNVIYKNYGRKFIEKIFPKLLTLKARELSSGTLVYDYNLENFRLMFKQVFCNTNIHERNIQNCPEIFKYIHEKNIENYSDIFKYMVTFRLQLYGVKSSTKVNYKAKEKNNYIAKPYPTFFVNNEISL